MTMPCKGTVQADQVSRSLIGGVKQHGADLGQAGQAEEGFVEQRIAEELGADGAARASVGELLEEVQDAVAKKELGEAIHELAGGRHKAIALPTLEGRDDGVAVFGDDGPVGTDFAGRHRHGSCPPVYHKT
jgi:hypothetical protein